MRVIDRDIVGAVIFDKNGKIFLAKKSSGGVWPNTWQIPGGGVEKDEDKESAINREIKEETGIDISKYPKVLISDTDIDEAEKTLQNGEKVWVKMKFFTYRVNLDEPNDDIGVTLNDELSEFIWVNPQDLKNYKLPPPSIKLFKNLKLL